MEVMLAASFKPLPHVLCGAWATRLGSLALSIWVSNGEPASKVVDPGFCWSWVIVLETKVEVGPFDKPLCKVQPMARHVWSGNGLLRAGDFQVCRDGLINDPVEQLSNRVRALEHDNITLRVQYNDQVGIPEIEE